MVILKNMLLVAAFVVLTVPVTSTGAAQELQENEYEDTKKKTRAEKRRERRESTGGGLLVGAIAGAALGSMVGEAGAGAAVGAVAVGAYTYDQQRQDERTQMMADAIAAPKYVAPSQPVSNQVAAGQPQPAPRETVGDVGKRGMQDFVGDWNLEMWSLATDGSRLTGIGQVRGMQTGENAMRVVFTQFESESFPEAQGGGHVLLSYEPDQGFFLESNFSYSDEVLKMVGEYLLDANKYNFYLVGAGGEMVTGILRSSVRVEIRSSGSALWVADTFAYIDGKETQVQSYRFTSN
jgi:hypothetical protein